MKALSKLKYLVLLIALISSTNCSKDNDDDTINATFSSIYSKLLSTTCISCHVPDGAATEDGANFDLTSQTTAFDTLTSNFPGGSQSGGCETVPLVNASNANGSYLSAVLFEDIHGDNFVVDDCTPYNEHHTDQNISTEERDAILGWINAGAANN